jgi:hypothetical protein
MIGRGCPGRGPAGAAIAKIRVAIGDPSTGLFLRLPLTLNQVILWEIISHILANKRKIREIR